MSTIYKSLYKRWNGIDWDIEYFRTSADIIDETTNYKVLMKGERDLITAFLGTVNPATPGSYTKKQVNQNYVLAGPASGGTGDILYRALVYNDIPDLSSYYLKFSVGGTLNANINLAEGYKFLFGGGSLVNAYMQPFDAGSSEAGIDFYTQYFDGGSEVPVKVMSIAGSVVNMNSNRITNLGTPTGDNDAVYKKWVEDLVAVGAHPAAGGPVKAASTGPLTITNPITELDGYTTAINDRVLIKDQATASENGIYYLNASKVPVKVAADSTQGNLVFVENGSTYNDWTFYNSDGTTWAAYTKIDTITAGSGLTKSGTQISVASLGITNGMLAGSINWSKLVDTIIYDNQNASYNEWTDLEDAGTTAYGLLTHISNLAGAIGILRGTPKYNTNNTQSISDLYSKHEFRVDSEIGAVVAAFATSNVTASGSQTINGYAVQNGDLVFLSAQTSYLDDGLWMVNTGGAWTHLLNPINHGYYSPENGTNADKLYQCVDFETQDYELHYNTIPVGTTIMSAVASA